MVLDSGLREGSAGFGGCVARMAPEMALRTVVARWGWEMSGAIPSSADAQRRRTVSMSRTRIAATDHRSALASAAQRCHSSVASSRTAASTSAAARARTHSLLVRRIVTQERCCCARKGTRAALAALGLLGIAARTQHLLSYARAYSPLSPPSALSASQHARSAFFLFRVPTLSFGRPLLLTTRSALCHARIQARTRVRARTIATRSVLRHACTHARTHARTHAHGRPTTNDATCGPPAWLTRRLHDGRIRSVCSPLRRAPFFATPIAKPLHAGRSERPGLLFLKILIICVACDTNHTPRVQRRVSISAIHHLNPASQWRGRHAPWTNGDQLVHPCYA